MSARPARSTGDPAVKSATGRTSDERYQATQDWSGPERRHPDIAQHLQDVHRVSPWWSQHNTVGYEETIGGRRPDERTEGHGTSAQRTLKAEPAALYQCFFDETKRKVWLCEVADHRHSEDFRRVADESWVLREAVQDEHLRYKIRNAGGPTGSTLDVRITPRTEGRTQVSVQHEGLASEAERVIMRAGWSEALDHLVVHFAEGRD